MDTEELLKYALYSRLSYYDSITEDDTKILPGCVKPITCINNPMAQGWIFRENHEIEDDNICSINGKASESLVIAFRGMDSIIDALYGICFVPNKFFIEDDPHCRVHIGYQKCYKAIRKDVFDIISKYDNIDKLIFTGHSMGGNISALCAYESSIQFKDKDIRHASYGSPPIGNNYFINKFQKRIQRSNRVTNDGDIIPKIPFNAHLPRHLELRLTNIQRNSMQIIRKHSLETYIHSLREYGCKKNIVLL